MDFGEEFYDKNLNFIFFLYIVDYSKNRVEKLDFLHFFICFKHWLAEGRGAKINCLLCTEIYFGEFLLFSYSYIVLNVGSEVHARCTDSQRSDQF